MTEHEWLDIFGDNLVSLMRDWNMSQSELSQRSGLSQSSISAYINKRKMPGVKALINIADVFDISLDDFMNFGDIIDW